MALNYKNPSERIYILDDLKDAIITSYCAKIGITLDEIDPYHIPKFRLDLSSINYNLIICKALFI